MAENEKKPTPRAWLKRARAMRGLSQAALAEQIGLGDAKTVRRWESGESTPYPHYREPLAEKLGITLEALEELLANTQERPLHQVWTLRHPQNLFLTGRDALLERLHDEFAVDSTAIPKQALIGLPGIGKTQAAVEYAYRYKDEYMAVLWIQADSEALLLSETARLATMLKLPIQGEQSQEMLVQAVKRWLASSPGWLLVLDNVEDPEMIGEFLSLSGEGHVLLTTRVQGIGAFASPIEIEKLTEEEGASFILHRAKLLRPSDTFDAAPAQVRVKAKAVASEMDGLPLALDQAAAYIEETQCGITAYLDRYRVRRAQLLARRGKRKSGHPDSLVTTLSLSFDKIERAHPASVELLRLCAFLHAEDIPEDIFVAGAPALGNVLGPAVADQGKLDEALAELLNYSLVERLMTGGLSIHRLVQAVLQDLMDEQTRNRWATRAVEAIARVLPPSEADVERFAPYLSHAQVCSELIEQRGLENEAAAHVLYMTGFCCREYALYARAEVLCQKALTLYEQKLGPRHREVANCLNNLALVYDETGRYAAAQVLFQRALDILKEVLSPAHPDVAHCLNNLARAYRFQSKLRQAEPLCQQSVAILEKALGPDHIDLAASLTTLATIYRDQGKYRQAEALYSRALAIREKNLPPEHLDIAFSLNASATNYAFQGDFTRAGELNHRALAIFEKVRGREHPDVALCLACLSDTYVFQKEYARAIQLNERALAIYAHVVGPLHPNIVQPTGNLAILHEMQGDYAQAESLYLRALDVLEKSLGPDYPDIVPVLWLYASLLKKMGRNDEAIRLLVRASNIQSELDEISRNR